MPISFRPVEEGAAIEWQQSFTSPAVFLDTWAIRKISTDPTLKRRLSKALKCKNGTLLLTLHVISEFSNLEDRRHATLADSLITSILPNLYLAQIDENFLSGIEKFDGRSSLIPPAAIEILDSLARRGDMPLDDRLSSLFFDIVGEKKIRGISVEIAKRFSAKIIAMGSDSNFRKKTKNQDISDSSTIEHKIFGELIRQSILNSENVSVNDFNDMMHALISVPFCDFVILDKKWVGIIERAHRRIDNAGANIKMPVLFSEKNNGIENFLGALEKF